MSEKLEEVRLVALRLRAISSSGFSIVELPDVRNSLVDARYALAELVIQLTKDGIDLRNLISEDYERLISSEASAKLRELKTLVKETEILAAEHIRRVRIGMQELIAEAMATPAH